MTLVKGPNGLVVDVAPSVASGLIGGGHVVAVDSDTEVEDTKEVTEDPSIEDEDDEADQAEDSDTEVEEDEPETGDVTKPGGNASKQVWYDYALNQGFAEEQLDGLKQNEIRALFED